MITARRRPKWSGWLAPAEWLEPRLALSSLGAVLDGEPAGSALRLAETVPADGAVVTRAPESFSVRFDRPLDPFSIGYDVELMRVEADGTETPLTGAGNAWTLDVAPEDPSRLVATLERPVEWGRYRLRFAAETLLAGADGAAPDPELLGAALAEFVVAPPADDPPAVVDLGAIDARAVLVGGRLGAPGAGDSSAVYRFTLTPDYSRWRLGAEVEAQRIGSPLEARLDLLDAGGRRLGAAELRRPGAPADPALFRGLPPGTYLLRVSGRGGDGGPFTLALAADPAETPTSLVSFRLDASGPDRGAPTGFRLRFNGPIAAAGRPTLGDALSGGVEVVDGAGRSWPIVAVGYDEEGTTLGYLFRRALPPGRYEVRVAASGGLSDLSGRPVVGRDGRSAMLAAFAVAPGRSPAGPGAIGALYPDDVLDGIRRRVTLAPGEARELPVWVLYGDFYVIEASSEGGPLEVALAPGAGPGGVASPYDLAGQAAPVRVGPADAPASTLVRLGEGPSVVRLVSRSDRPVTVELKVSIGRFGWESVLANGVGQGPALGLRLVSPSGDLPPLAFDEAPAPGPGAVAPPASSVVEGRGPEVVTPLAPAPTTPGSSLASTPGGSLAAGASTGPLGLPQAAALEVASLVPGAAHPTMASEAVFLASTGAPIGFGQSPAAGGLSLAPFPAEARAHDEALDELAGESPAVDGGERSGSGLAPEGLTGPWRRLADWLAGWTVEVPAELADAAAPADDAVPGGRAGGALVLDRDDVPEEEGLAPRLGAPLGIGLASLVAIRLRDRLVRRARRGGRGRPAGLWSTA